MHPSSGDLQSFRIGNPDPLTQGVRECRFGRTTSIIVSLRRRNMKVSLVASGDRLRARSIPKASIPDHSNQTRVHLVHRRMPTPAFCEFAVPKWHSSTKRACSRKIASCLCEILNIGVVCNARAAEGFVSALEHRNCGQCIPRAARSMPIAFCTSNSKNIIMLC